MSTLQAGHARACITPPLGIGMAGYGARTAGADGVHDDLFVDAVALSDGCLTVALLAFDLCLFDAALAAETKAAVAATTGLPPAQVFLNTSHTHAGPRVPGAHEAHGAYRATLTTRAAAAAAAAVAALRPAGLAVGRAPLDIGCNRRERLADGRVILGHNPDGPTCHQVSVWRLVRPAAPDIVLFSTPMHGTTLGGHNLSLSTEWMGLARTRIEAADHDVRAVFVQGCGADQDPYYSLQHGVRGTFAEVAQHGRAAAAAVGQALEQLTALTSLPLTVLSREVALPGKERAAESCRLQLHGLRLGEAVLLALNAEAFVAYADFGRQVSPARETLVLGYTDGNIGYLGTERTLAEGGYEADVTRVAPESAALARAAMAEALCALAQ